MKPRQEFNWSDNRAENHIQQCTCVKLGPYSPVNKVYSKAVETTSQLQVENIQKSITLGFSTCKLSSHYYCNTSYSQFTWHLPCIRYNEWSVHLMMQKDVCRLCENTMVLSTRSSVILWVWAFTNILDPVPWGYTRDNCTCCSKKHP